MLKTVLIHGQNHKGSTYHIAHELAEKLGGEITEFFLPRDFGEFCLGCTTCFLKSRSGNVQPGLKTKALFFAMHLLQRKGINPRDAAHWQRQGWTGSKRPWK